MNVVSIIVPTKNSARTIKRCLQSVIRQTYPHIELIVVDNYSQDSTYKIAYHYADVVITAAPERSAQKNSGVQKAKGTYLFFLDADMYLTPSVIEECIQKIKLNIKGIYIPEKIYGQSLFAKLRNYERSFYNGTCIDAIRFIKKIDFECLGGFDEMLSAGEDWDLDRRARNLGKTTIIHAPLYHDESNSNLISYIAKKMQYASTIDLYIKKWHNHPELKKQLGLYYRYIGVFIENKKWQKIIAHPIQFIAIISIKIIIGLNYLIKK